MRLLADLAYCSFIAWLWLVGFRVHIYWPASVLIMILFGVCVAMDIWAWANRQNNTAAIIEKVVAAKIDEIKRGNG